MQMDRLPYSSQDNETVAQEATDPDEDVDEGEDRLDEGKEDEELGAVAGGHRHHLPPRLLRQLARGRGRGGDVMPT